MEYRCKYQWGGWIWGYIHTICILNYLDHHTCRERIKMLKSVQDIIVCSTCRQSYKIYIDKLDNLEVKPLYLFYWSIDLHNYVNKKLKKPEWSYEEALSKWSVKS